MGLRCLLGHDFTEPRTEREREERGDEVIIAIRRVKECRRCGETRVVSENKEVTSMSQPLGGPGADDGSEDAASPAASDAGGRTDGAERTGAADAARDGDDADSLIANAEEGFDHPEADVDAVDTDVENDAEIIRSEPPDAADAADDSGGRGRGEWPEADVNRSTGAVGRDTDGDDGAWASGGDGEAPTDPGPAAGGEAPTDPADEDAEFVDADAAGGAGDAGTGDDRVPWPDHDGDDEGFDAAPGGEETTADPADPADDDTGEADAATAGAGGEYIEAESEPLDDSRWGAPRGSGRSESGAGTEDGAADDGATDAPAVSGVELKTTSGDPEAEYVCPECGAREPVGASSTRAGDICPDCKRGYIEERELE